MPGRIKNNSLIVAALAVAYYLYFMYTKHNPSLAAIIPFGNDPYDAIGSYAVIFSPLLVILTLLRTLRGYGSPESEEHQKIYLIRSQISIPVALIIALSADLISMIRYPQVWMNKAATLRLIYLTLAMIIITLWVLFMVHRAGVTLYEPRSVNIRSILITSLAFIAVLAIYPAAMTGSFILELITLFISILLFFIPLAVLSGNFIPYRFTGGDTGPGNRGRFNPWMAWLVILSIGILLGIFIIAGEYTGKGGGHASFLKILTVASFYIGTTVVAAIVGFIALKKPLGLYHRDE